MDLSNTSSENLVTNSTYTVLKGDEKFRGSSREYDTAGWTFNFEMRNMSNLAFLPIVAIVILVLSSLFMAYRWSRQSSRRKVEMDVEFSEDTEPSYQIVNVGDRDFCPVDVCSDGVSVYDTINSIRLLENGFAIQLNETHPYHDTVTSYKSMLMQRADGSQYDSVKSYKAFLQKVTQNKDLAVEVKLLENYPIHSKSAEHCVVLEEESSEKSGEVTTKLLGMLPLNKQLHKDGRFTQIEKKKLRYRRASGDAPSTMRKRSASNPTFRRRVTNQIGSLPSVHYTGSLSSDSEEDNQQSFILDRKKLWAERKKLARSVSGGKISKDTSNTILSNGHNIGEAPSDKKRVRHFSADGTKRHKKAAISYKKNSSNSVNNENVKNTPEITINLTENVEKMSVDSQVGESSSENPASSNSSDSDVVSDVVVSDSDVDTKRNTQRSTTSDDQTVDNDVFFSLDSGAELASSAEILQNCSERPISDTKIQIARAKEEFFQNKENHAVKPLAVTVSKTLTAYSDNKNSNTLSDVTCMPTDSVQTPSDHNSHSTSTDVRKTVHSQHLSEPCLGSKTESLSNISKSLVSTGSQYASEGVRIDTLDLATSTDNEKTKNLSSPHMVQRFHVTFVNNDIPSLSSE